MEQMTTDADGRVRMEFVMPVRGLVGYRGQLLTETRGTGLLHQIGEGYGPWAGDVTHRTTGVLVSDRTGTSNAYGLFNLQERATMLIGAGEEVYEGMVVGENSRPGDMDVNPTKEKKLTNIRTHSHDEGLRLTPPPPMTLESAIEFIAADELVEVTPNNLRLRKRALSQHDRRRAAGREYDERRAAEKAESRADPLRGAGRLQMSPAPTSTACCAMTRIGDSLSRQCGGPAGAPLMRCQRHLGVEPCRRLRSRRPRLTRCPSISTTLPPRPCAARRSRRCSRSSPRTTAIRRPSTGRVAVRARRWTRLVSG